jgi:Na+-transporting methylmalonyl-CoA/oxaloacetate decarboxylase gamma subunit
MTFAQGEIASMQSFQSRVVAAWIVAPVCLLLTLVIDGLGAVIRRIFPERAETPKPVA